MTTEITNFEWLAELLKNLDEKVCGLSDKNNELKLILKDALPHVEQMANECSTGPMLSSIDYLVIQMEHAILEDS